jgi:hypothetical protein
VLALLVALGGAAGSARADETKVAAMAATLDRGLERFYAKDLFGAAPILFEAFTGLPDSEIKHDVAEFNLAEALSGLGFRQASLELYIDIIAARRAPELVARALGRLDEALRRGALDERRLIDTVLFGNQFGDVPVETEDFVEYYQALGELRRGFSDWGTQRLRALAQHARFYGFRARFALAVESWKAGQSEAAIALFRSLIDNPETPTDVRNDALVGVARRLYEERRFAEAFELYSRVDAPLAEKDVVLLEQAWDRVLAEDERRALGMVVGLGAPVYRHLFAPEKALIQAMAFNRLCQFRRAHLAVLDFQKRYRASLRQVREQKPPLADPILKDAVLGHPALKAIASWRERLGAERARLSELRQPALQRYLDGLYKAKLEEANHAVERSTDAAFSEVAAELLRIEEQMTILDYEIGVGLFRRATSAEVGKSAGDDAFERAAATNPLAVRYRFDGEYWSDELQAYSVETADRCLR